MGKKPTIWIMAMVACLLGGLLVQPATAKEALEVSLMFSSGNQRSLFVKILREFEQQNPDIELKRREIEQERYKADIEDWLSSAEGKSDVYFWFAGEKLNSFVEKGLVAKIDDLWHSANWDKVFSKGSKSAVSQGGNVYGLPLSYYQWGFYYQKPLFEQYGLQEPQTWEEFFKVCETFKKNDIIPITLGSKWRWTAAGWFDYLNLRINGLQFHMDLMAGKVPYTDERVKNVFKEWRKLVDNGYFIEKHNSYDWKQALPFLYRQKAAMLLMGNFLIPQVPEKVLPDIGFFRFPQINPELPYYEEAPMDILILANNAKNPEAGKKLLKFFGGAEVQFELNSGMGMNSPNTKAKVADDRFIQAGAQILEEAQGISQFYDRDTHAEIYNAGMDAMVAFLENPATLDAELAKVEAARQKVMGQ